MTHRLPHGKLPTYRARLVLSDPTPRPTDQPIKASILPYLCLKTVYFIIELDISFREIIFQ